MPDAVVAVLGDEQAAIGQLQNGDRAAPNFALVGPKHPAGEDFAYGTGGLAILEGDEGDGLADALGAVPRSVEGEEGPALVFLGELTTSVENEVQHGNVRAQQDIALNRLGHQVWAHAFVAGIFVGPGVGERPTVEGALLDVGEVVGYQVVTELVALLHGRPEGIGARVIAQSDRVAGAGCEYFMAAAVGVIAVDGGAPGIFARRDVGAGTGAHTVGYQVVTELVALLYGRPEGIGARVIAQADRVAGAGCEYFMAAAVGVIAVDGGGHEILA